MKRIIIIAIILSSFGMVKAQTIERNNSELPILTEVINSLNSSDGWRKSSAGQWVQSKSNLGYSFIPWHLEVESSDRFSISNSDNFKTIHIRRMSYKNKEYYVVFIRKSAGSFKYPALRQDWIDYESVSYYVVDSLPVIKYEMNKATTIELDIVFSSTVSNTINPITDDVICKSISSLFDKYYKDKFNSFIAFDIFPILSDENKTMRFNFRFYNSGDKKRCEEYGDSCPVIFGKFSKSKPNFKPLIFDEKYFETDLVEFQKLFTFE